MNSGKYVFSQVLALVNKYEFEKLVKKYEGNYRVKELTCWYQFVPLFFEQITNLNSVRDICFCLKAHHNKLHHLGIKNFVDSATLSQANEKLSCQIFEDFAHYLIKTVGSLYKDASVHSTYIFLQIQVLIRIIIIKDTCFKILRKIYFI